MTSTTAFSEYQAEQPEEILKRDVLGRVKMPAARREALLDEFEQSGVSGAKFSALVGVKYTTFASWRQARERRKRQGQQPRVVAQTQSDQQIRWLEAVVQGHRSDSLPKTEAKSGSLKVELADGSRLEISNSAGALLAAELIRGVARR
jgi:hypothetical protein